MSRLIAAAALPAAALAWFISPFSAQYRATLISFTLTPDWAINELAVRKSTG